jgi:LuxR family maltose regulon positive regulatory protein
LIEPLSQREEEVLRLLATSLSTAEMAEELCIAVSTLRTHIKNIYGKLQVHSRTEAVLRGQEMDLL